MGTTTKGPPPFPSRPPPNRRRIKRHAASQSEVALHASPHSPPILLAESRTKPFGCVHRSRIFHVCPARRPAQPFSVAATLALSFSHFHLRKTLSRCPCGQGADRAAWSVQRCVGVQEADPACVLAISPVCRHIGGSGVGMVRLWQPPVRGFCWGWRHRFGVACGERSWSKIVWPHDHSPGAAWSGNLHCSLTRGVYWSLQRLGLHASLSRARDRHPAVETLTRCG